MNYKDFEKYTVKYPEKPNVVYTDHSLISDNWDWAFILKNFRADDVHNYSKSDTSLKIKKVIFNPPATIVFWDDNTKTVVKDDENYWIGVHVISSKNGYSLKERWRELGLLNAIAKKFYSNYEDEIRKWCDDNK